MIPRERFLASTIDTGVTEAIERVLASGNYILGPEVERFERHFAEFVGKKHCIACGSGTDALFLALKGIHALGPIRVPTLTAQATVAAVVQAGCQPHFVDITEEYHMDPEGIGSGFETAILVHLYGRKADYHLYTGDGPGNLVIGDYAQHVSQGCQAEPIGCYSFYPTKNLAALGDAGAVCVDSNEVASRIRGLRQYGWQDGTRKSDVAGGVNSRMDEIQAAVLNFRLGQLEWNNIQRTYVAEVYKSQFEGYPLVLPNSPQHVYHQYVVRTEKRDELFDYLRARNIMAGIHYPELCHEMLPYRFYATGKEFPVAKQIASEILSLPVYPAMTSEEVLEVCEAVQSFFD